MIFICYDCGHREEKSGQNGPGNCINCDSIGSVFLENES